MRLFKQLDFAKYNCLFKKHIHMSNALRKDAKKETKKDQKETKKEQKDKKSKPKGPSEKVSTFIRLSGL